MTTEKLISLPDGRTLAYEDAGTLTSLLVIIFFNGTMSVGSAARPSSFLTSKRAHFVAPTIPGHGKTSPPNKGVSYAATIAADTSALLDHLYPDAPHLELYIGGGSYGTVPAQMLYGSPFDVFPAGRHIKGLLLISAFPPFKNDKEKNFVYTRYMTWTSYIGIGPPARVAPFRLMQNATFIRGYLFDKMGEDEKKKFEIWREQNGYEEGQLEREMAQLSRRSIEKSWEGFLSTAAVLHGDWGWGGKGLGELDPEHTEGRNVMVVASKCDEGTPGEWGEYLASKYRNSRMKWLDGSHIVAIFHWDEIWAEFLGI